jgi:hypothetical protein
MEIRQSGFVRVPSASFAWKKAAFTAVFFIDFVFLVAVCFDKISHAEFRDIKFLSRKEEMKDNKSSCTGKAKYLAGKRILPEPIDRDTDIVTLIDNMDAYNGGRLRAACHLLRDKFSQEDVTIGLSLAGELTTDGL